MLTGFCNWLDHRTGYRRLVSALLIEHIPGGAKWRYVWGSALAFVFFIQLVTGILLMTAYSPSPNSAWGSVHYIQYEMDFGWLIRGLHHYGSQTMVVLLGIHMLQVVIAGAHLPPREVNWWLGLLLMGVVLAMSLTGYLLPWDQKGYFATKVATNIAGSMPLIGPDLQKFIVGGPEYGNQTLTRFYALHVGILPLVMILLIIMHLVVFRRHGVTHPANPKGEGWFWPDQAFRDLLISIIIFGVMIGLVVFAGHGNKIESAEPVADSTVYEKMAHAGRDGYGANLDAPADPATENYPARPEWYFLFLFQLLKYFEGDQEIVGTAIIPGIVTGLLFLLPLLGYGRMRKFGHGFGVLAVVFVLASVGTLTILAFNADRPRILTKEQIDGIASGELKADNPNLTPEQEKQISALDKKGLEEYKRVRDLNVAFRKSHQLANRAVDLAHTDGIPAEGSQSLLRRDPKTQGPILFRTHCAVCHSHSSADPAMNFILETPAAMDLGGYGGEQWIRGLLEKPNDAKYFGSLSYIVGAGGKPRFRTMSEWVEKKRADPLINQEDLSREFDDISRWLATHPRQLPPVDELRKEDAEQKDQSDFAKGYRKFRRLCIECHTYHGDGGTTASGPDFTGYGDAPWLRQMLQAPYDKERYGNKNAMPNFRDFESTGTEFAKLEFERFKQNLIEEAGDDPKLLAAVKARLAHIQITDLERELIIRWLIGDYRLIFGGEPMTVLEGRRK